MKSLPCLLLGFAFGSAPLLFADPAPQPPVSFTEGTSGTWNLDWAGVTARTYFLQGSQDLVSWDYAPMVEFGTGVKSFGMVTGGADKYFVRLQYTDDPAVANVEEAREADFDLDGMPNYFEIIHGFNPTNATGDNGATGDPDGDGFGNLAEYQFGSDPDDSADHPVGKISANSYHSVALTADGRVWSWGYNNSGQLGDGTNTNRSLPVPISGVPEMSKIVEIGTGENFTLALDDNGILWGWGANSNRQISKDSTYRFLKPVRIELPGPVSRFACGNTHALALGRDGKLWAWGTNYYGELGQAHNNTVNGFVEIVKPTGMQNVKTLAAGEYNSYAVDVAGKMWAWGYNFYGELGDGSNTNRFAPVPVDISNGVPAIKSIDSGGNHALASGIDGSIWSWGLGNYGQLGRGSTSSSNKPVNVTTGLTDASAIAAGESHSLAVSPSGVVWAWGRSNRGQLGNNSTSTSNIPVQTSPVTDWSDILRVATRNDHNIAMKSDGSVWSWGYNYYGQLGLGDTNQRNEPVRLANLKLADDDSDFDGVPDSFERFHFAGSLAFPGNHITVTGGASITDAYAYRLNPNFADNDNDGISDSVEIAAGLDPLDWSDASGDLDGDRIPNLWEQEMGSDMLDDGSTPDDTVEIVLTVSSGQSIQSAINSVPANASNPTWAIIKVQPGIYKENVSLPYTKRILLVSVVAGGVPEIRGTGTAQTVGISGESVIDGFRITHEKDITGYGVQSFPYNGRELVRIVNCMIHDNNGTYGSGIVATQGRTVIAHCTVYKNSGTYDANGLVVGSSAQVMLLNSIFRNPGGVAPAEIKVSGLCESRRTVVGDASLPGGIIHDPLLNPRGFLTQDSPSRGQGTTRAFGFLDIDGEERGASPDIGADQFADSDGDGLPDTLEALGIVSVTADNDNDGLLNLIEYETAGSDPLEADTDGDGLNDGGEIAAGSNPFDPDTDTDGMEDGYEVDYGLNPTDDTDALEDPDGDRIPNLYEFKNGKTAPKGLNAELSFPATHITVDPATVTETPILKKTIQSAINESMNAGRYTVILVKAGIYVETPTINNRKILLLGELAPVSPVIAPASGSAMRFNEGSAVLDGFTLKRTSPISTVTGFTMSADDKRDQCRLVNCTIIECSASLGSAVYAAQGRLTVAQCTIINNEATSGSPLYVGTGELILQNSIVWNPANPAEPQVEISSYGSATATTSIVLGGQLGGNPAEPLTDRYHCLMPGSPAIGAGTSLPVSSLDRHGEPRPSLAPDIGADQRVDSDSDFLPDWWEKSQFGNLVKSDTDDNETPVPDRLTVRYEYLLGFDPTNPNTLGNGSGDLFNAVFTSSADPWYPAEWRLDTDGDGLTDGQELYYGTSASNSDTNGDGIPDKTAIQSGISATSLDTDGDGVSNAQEIISGTNPFLFDTDGDGVADNLDAFPLDPSRWEAPAGTPGDVTAPQIVLITPENATPL